MIERGPRARGEGKNPSEGEGAKTGGARTLAKKEFLWMAEELFQNAIRKVGGIDEEQEKTAPARDGALPITECEQPQDKSTQSSEEGVGYDTRIRRQRTNKG